MEELILEPVGQVDDVLRVGRSRARLGRAEPSAAGHRLSVIAMLLLLDTREVIDGELRLGGLRLVDNVDAGDWVVAGTHGWSVVHQLVPEVFEAYARVFHPAYRQVEDDE